MPTGSAKAGARWLPKRKTSIGPLDSRSSSPNCAKGRGEIERGLKGKLPTLVTDRDLLGVLHCHTDASDGTETLERMAKATRERGFHYFGVADHSLVAASLTKSAVVGGNPKRRIDASFFPCRLRKRRRGKQEGGKSRHADVVFHVPSPYAASALTAVSAILLKSSSVFFSSLSV
jgi:hypothetical protein